MINDYFKDIKSKRVENWIKQRNEIKESVNFKPEINIKGKAREEKGE